MRTFWHVAHKRISCSPNITLKLKHHPHLPLRNPSDSGNDTALDRCGLSPIYGHIGTSLLWTRKMRGWVMVAVGCQVRWFRLQLGVTHNWEVALQGEVQWASGQNKGKMQEGERIASFSPSRDRTNHTLTQRSYKCTDTPIYGFYRCRCVCHIEVAGECDLLSTSTKAFESDVRLL